MLAVVAHPDDESFGLGAMLEELITHGARARVVCFTHGEASTLHGSPGKPALIRSQEQLIQAVRYLDMDEARARLSGQSASR